MKDETYQYATDIENLIRQKQSVDSKESDTDMLKDVLTDIEGNPAKQDKK